MFWRYYTVDMRGKIEKQTGLFCLINLEELVADNHPVRQVKAMFKEVLTEMSPVFEEMYARDGRPSVPPERLLLGWVLMALYSVRSCRQFTERLRYDLLFKWFLDMNPDESAFDATVYSKNMERFETHEVSEVFFAEVVELARRYGWISDEHFTVDGTLIESWASMKSFRKKGEPPPPGDRNEWVDFKGQKRSNKTHRSSTDPDARLMRKGPGREAKLSFGLRAAMENRSGLLVMLNLTKACGKGSTESTVALDQMQELCMRGFEPRTVGADKAYHSSEFVQGCRDMQIAPHVARMQGRTVSGIDRRTTRHESYRASQRIRKRIEEPFGWMKTVGGFRKSRFIGVARTNFVAQLVGASCNLVRMAKMATHDPPVFAAA